MGKNTHNVKDCLLALIYGASESEDPDHAIPGIVGVEKAAELYEHPVFGGLMGDARKVGKAAVKNAERVAQGSIRVVNAMRKKIEASRPWREILAHLIQGIGLIRLNFNKGTKCDIGISIRDRNL